MEMICSSKMLIDLDRVDGTTPQKTELSITTIARSYTDILLPSNIV
jgi:hypothetical protein